jgi:hypothetical protein
VECSSNIGNKGGIMRKITIALIALVALTVIGCQPPEGMGGVTTEQLEGVKTELMNEIEGLKTDFANLHTALDSLTTIYNGHVEKFHKGGMVAPKPQPKPAPAPVQK